MSAARSGDHDRQRVYDAEEAAFGGTTLDEPLSWDDVEVLMSAVTSDRWWTELAIPAPRLLRARADARTSRADGSAIRICRDGQTALTLIHELGHHLSGHLPWPSSDVADSAHGPRFRASALRVAMVVAGPVAVDQLARAWRSHGLSVTIWAFPEPVSRRPRALRGARAQAPPPRHL
jgi:hypothetical protein